VDRHHAEKYVKKALESLGHWCSAIESTAVKDELQLTIAFTSVTERIDCTKAVAAVPRSYRTFQLKLVRAIATAVRDKSAPLKAVLEALRRMVDGLDYAQPN